MALISLRRGNWCVLTPKVNRFSVKFQRIFLRKERAIWWNLRRKINILRVLIRHSRLGYSIMGQKGELLALGVKLASTKNSEI